MARSNFGDGQSIATAKALHTCTRNGRGGHISPENPAQNLTYAAETPIAALIITEALFAAACKVALDKWL